MSNVKQQNPFATVATLVKRAGPDPVAAAGEALQAQLRERGMADVRNIGLAALGVGAGARGLVGLWNMARRKMNPSKPKYPGAIVTEVPIPVEKEAGVLFGDKPPVFSHQSNFPWYYPAAMLATGVGAIGGWKGVDALLQHRRKSEQAEEQDDARGEFETALLDRYSRPRKAYKTAGDVLGDVLDQLYDHVYAMPTEKRASWWDDTVGTGLGAYAGFYALPTAAIAGAMAYNRGKKNSDRAVLEKAMQLRVRRSYASRPPEMLAIPKPVEVGRRNAVKDRAMLESAEQETPSEAVEPMPLERPRRRRVDR